MTPVIKANQNFRSRWYCPLYLVLVFGCFSIAGCFGDVAHDNPFDPRADGFLPVARLSGQILDRTDQPVPSVVVQLEEKVSTTTFQASSNQQGRFLFDGIPAGAYRVTAEKQGFAVLVDSIEIKEFEDIDEDLMLNGAPQFDQIYIRTAHINRVWPPPTEFTLLEVITHVSDFDGDIDLEKTWLEVPALGVSDTLMFTQDAGVFSKDLDVNDLGIANMQDILGKEIMLKAQDRLGYVSETAPLTVARLITQTPVAVGPQAGTVLNEPQPILTWVCQEIPFSFRYRVEVVRVDDVVRNSVTVLDELDPAAICANQEGNNQPEASVQVDVPLNIGSYFWTVSIVDDFGNWSRSKEAGFVIN